MTIAEIQKGVAARYGVTVGEIVGGCGEPRVIRPHQVAIYLARKHTTASLPEIAAAFQETIANVWKTTQDIEVRSRIDCAFAAEVEDLRRGLGLDHKPAQAHPARTPEEEFCPSVTMPEELDPLAERVERLYRIMRWGFSGLLAGIAALMICFCDSCLKTRLDKVAEYSALLGLFGYFSVSILVVMRALMKSRQGEKGCDIRRLSR